MRTVSHKVCPSGWSCSNKTDSTGKEGERKDSWRKWLEPQLLTTGEAVVGILQGRSPSQGKERRGRESMRQLYLLPQRGGGGSGASHDNCISNGFYNRFTVIYIYRRRSRVAVGGWVVSVWAPCSRWRRCESTIIISWDFSVTGEWFKATHILPLWPAINPDPK